MENKNKRVFVATIGTFLEWAEFTYYAYISNEIAKLFFPTFSSQAGTVAAFSIFAIGYIFRPLGALFFGYLGDQYGRRLALQLSILLMGVSSVVIGCLPTFKTIGIAAPILLLLFRCLQGFAVSGEFNGSAIYLIEHDPQKPCRAGSWTGLAAALGMMFGSLMSALIYLPSMPTWSWRLPFLLGALSCFCGMYFRKNFSESPAFLRLERKKNNPVIDLLKHHKQVFLKALALITATGVYLYIMNVYYSTHLIKYTNFSAAQTKLIVTFGETFTVLFIAFFARFADKWNDKRLFIIGLWGFCIAAPFAYWAPLQNSLTLILLGQIGYALCDGLISVPLFKLLNDLFPVTIRYTGISTAWCISMALFGGTAPLVATYLQDTFNNPIAPAYYIILTTLIALRFGLKEKPTQAIPFEGQEICPTNN